MNSLTSFLEAFARRLTSMFSAKLDAQLGRAFSNWESAGGGKTTSSSSPGRGASPGFGMASRAVQWMMGGDSSHGGSQSSPYSGAAGGNSTTSATSIVDLFLRRLLALINPQQTPGQFGNPGAQQNQVTEKTAGGVLKQVLSQLRNQFQSRKSGQKQRSKWIAARQSPLKQMSRSRDLAMKAAGRYVNLGNRRDSLKLVMESAQKRFLSAPKPGEAGYNAARSTSLLNQSTIAGKAYEVADTRATAALERVGQTARLFANSTNVTAGALRMVGGLASKAFSIVGAIYTGARIGAQIPGMAQSAAESAVEQGRGSANYSMRTAMAYAAYDRQTESLNFRQADATSQTQTAMIDSVKRFRESVLPWKTFWGDVGNTVKGGAADLGTWYFRDFLGGAGNYLVGAATGNLFNKDYWASVKEQQEAAKGQEDKQNTVFFDVMQGWANVSDRQKKEALGESKPRDMLKPFK